MPIRARAALVVDPARLVDQEAVSRSLLLPRALHAFRVPRALGARAETCTILLLESTAGWQTMAVIRGGADLGDDFARLRGDAAGFAGGHEIYRVDGGGSERITRLASGQIAEGTEAALRTGLGAQPPVTGRRLEVQRMLGGLPAAGSPVHVVYVAPPDGADLVQMLSEASVLWNLDLGVVLEPYEVALRMLGSLHGLRADLWQEEEGLRLRLVLAAPNAAAAQRSQLALRAAQQFAPLASEAGVKTGSVTRAEAELLQGVLDSMRSRVEQDRVHVDMLLPPASRP